MEHRDFRADRTLPRPIGGIKIAGLFATLAALLVFFMMWTPNDDWVPDLPAATNAPIQPDPWWGDLFTITAEGTVYVDRRPVSARELDEAVRASCHPSMRFIVSEHLYVEADPELSYATVLDILERCRAHGGGRAVLVTKRNVTILEAWASGSMPSLAEWRRALEEQTPAFFH